VTLTQVLEIFNHYGRSGGVCFGMCGHCTGKNVRCQLFTATKVDGGVLINGFVNPPTGHEMVDEVCSENWLLDTIKGWEKR